MEEEELEYDDEGEFYDFCQFPIFLGTSVNHKTGEISALQHPLHGLSRPGMEAMVAIYGGWHPSQVQDALETGYGYMPDCYEKQPQGTKKIFILNAPVQFN